MTILAFASGCAASMHCLANNGDAAKAKASPPSVAPEDLLGACSLLEEELPKSATGFSPGRMARLLAQIDAVESMILRAGRDSNDVREWSDAVARRMAAKRYVDRSIDVLLSLHGQFAALKPEEVRRDTVRRHRQSIHNLLALSGRMQHDLGERWRMAAARATPRPADRDRMVQLAAGSRSRLAAAIVSWWLIDTPLTAGVPPAPAAVKQRILSAVAASRRQDVLPVLALYLQTAGPPKDAVELDVRLSALEAAAAIGLPQEPLPRGRRLEPADVAPHPRPVPATMLPEDLSTYLSNLPERAAWPADLKARADALDSIFRDRMTNGCDPNVYQIDGGEFQPGDWLLMRGSSPYHLFTDLSPGLYTHIGVVASYTPSDGKRRVVVVEVVEQAATVQAVLVEDVLPTTLHYMVLRHADRA
ncbi:MAG: hypothetical protein ACRC1K_13275, partial [Planctomycetia bacterium]